MKKRITILVVFGLMVLGCNAQYEITYANNAPKLGDKVTINSNVDVLVPSVGGSGANQQWDFSQYETTTSAELDFVDPDDTPWGGQVGDCNIAAYSNMRDQTAEFFKITNSSMVLKYLGTTFNEISQLTEYSDDYLAMEYPFAFNDQLSDTYAYIMEIVLGGMTSVMISEGTINTIADGWGSIITPVGSYSNVLRIKTIVVDNYETWYNGELFASGTDIQTSYSWYHESCVYPVMSIGYYDETSDYALIRHCSMGTHITENEVLPLSIYPNPAINVLSIDNNRGSNDCFISIYDCFGNLMLKQLANTPLTNISTLSFPNGVYYLVLDDRKQNTFSTEKFVVAH